MNQTVWDLTPYASLQWSKILQSQLNIFISWPERNFHKKIDATARDIGESVKEAQEGKSQKKP